MVEDEKIQAAMLRKLLTELGAQVVGIAGSAHDAITMIDELKPDAVFLDINLGDGDGFQVLERIKHKPYVVFTTAYSEYAVRAFEVHAVDYIVKPVRKERLRAALERVQEWVSLKRAGTSAQLEASLVESLKRELTHRGPSVVPIELDEEVVFLKPASILYLEAFEHKTKVVSTEGEFVIREPVKSFEERLPREKFLRVHKSFVVNIEHVSKIVKNYFGGTVIVMTNGAHVPVGRAYKEALSTLLGKG